MIGSSNAIHPTFIWGKSWTIRINHSLLLFEWYLLLWLIIRAPSLSKQSILAQVTFSEYMGLKCFNNQGTTGPSDQPGKTGTHSIHSSLCSVTSKHEVPFVTKGLHLTLPWQWRFIAGACMFFHCLTAMPGTYLDLTIHELRNHPDCVM